MVLDTALCDLIGFETETPETIHTYSYTYGENTALGDESRLMMPAIQ